MRCCKFLFLTYLIVSCNHKVDYIESDECHHIEIQFNKATVDDSLHLSYLFSDVQYVLLENTPDNKPIGVISDIKVINEYMYIHDSHMHRILHYDLSGKYLGQLSAQGRGPGEYLNINKFDVNPQTGEISILDLYSKRVYVYYSTYKYKEYFSINNVPRDFTILANGNYLFFTPDYMKGAKYGLWMTDSQGNFINDILEIPSRFKYNGGLSERYFHRFGNTVYIYPSVYYDNIYHIKSDTLSVGSHLEVDIKIPKRVANMNYCPLDEFAGQVYTIRMCYEVENWIIIEAYDMQTLVGVVYNKKTGKVFYYNSPDDIINDMPYSGQFITTTDNALIGVVYSDFMLDYPPLVEQYPDINEDSNPIIAISYTK